MLKISDRLHRIQTSVARMRGLIATFGSNTRGNVAMMTALAAVPMLAGIGCVVDYTMASMVRTKLQAIADSATLATVSNNSPIVASAKTSGTVTNGNAYATNFFNAGAGSVNSAVTNLTPT